MAQNPDKAVLNSIYRNAKTGVEAITDLLPKVSDRAFKADIMTQQGQYESISKEAASRLINLGTEPVPVGTMQKLGMKMGTAMNTLTNDETSHLAELMIKGSNMGIINMTKVVNGYSSAAPETLGLAQKLIKSEQNNIARLKAYLR